MFHNALHVLHTQSLYVNVTAGQSLIEGFLMERITHHLTKDNNTVFGTGTRLTKHTCKLESGISLQLMGN